MATKKKTSNLGIGPGATRLLERGCEVMRNYREKATWKEKEGAELESLKGSHANNGLQQGNAGVCYLRPLYLSPGTNDWEKGSDRGLGQD